MKQLFPLQVLCLLLIPFGIINAQSITQTQSEQVAKNLVYEQWNKHSVPLDYNDVNISFVYTFQEEGISWFNVYKVEDGGFVIVSTHRGILPVIGYSHHGSFPVDFDKNSNYGSYLYSYVVLAKEGDNPSGALEKQWNYYLTDDYRNIDISTTRNKGVEPLVSDIWNQDYPYNILCPEDSQGSGGHVYAGCVATAMSQIMYYWRYPETGQGTHGYYSDYGYLSVDYGSTNYNWNAMQNDIDPRNPWAIGELQYHAGVGVDMNYSPTGSGAWPTDARYAMENFFKYPDVQYKNRDNFTTNQWKEMLMAELDVARPIAYYGYSDNGGHAFVCDGYQDDLYHFNFGWSGTGNGWYTLNDINGFHYWQQCLRYLEPDPAEYPYYFNGQITLTEKSGSFTDGSGPINNYLDNTSATWIIDPQTPQDSVSSITLIFEEFELGENDVLTIYDGDGPNAPVYGSYSGTNSPGVIHSTGNILCVSFESDGSNTGPGFYAEYNSMVPEYCTGMQTFTEESGVFSDGSGTFNYNNSSLCFYKIVAGSGKDIILNFNYFETEETLDFVKVYDNQELISTFSGSSLPSTVVASSGIMLIAFKTNSFTTADGWEAHYSTSITAIEDRETIPGLLVYPVPASDQLNVSFNADQNDELVLTLSNVSGEIVYREKEYLEAGIFEKSLETSNLSDGIYFLRIKTSRGISTKKIVINQ